MSPEYKLSVSLQKRAQYVVHDVSKLLAKSNCNAFLGVPLVTEDLREWLGVQWGHDEPLPPQLPIYDRLLPGVNMCLRQTPIDRYAELGTETSISLDGRTKQGDSLTVTYVLNTDAENNLIEGSGVYFESSEIRLKDKVQGPLHPVTEKEIDRELYELEVLDDYESEFEANQTASLQFFPLTFSDLETIDAALRECQPFA